MIFFRFRNRNYDCLPPRWRKNLFLKCYLILVEGQIVMCQVGGLQVDNVFHPAQWLNHWIYAETVLIQLRKKEGCNLLGYRRRS